MSMYPTHVKIVEVGPRDGLQNEAQSISVAAKVSLIEQLAEAGCKFIESGSFVSPKWIPQMADSHDVMTQISRQLGVRYSALTPNMKGLEAAIDARADEVAIFASASETFSHRNINCSIKESLNRFRPLMQRAKQYQLQVRGYVSCVLGCPYEGNVPAETVADTTRALFDLGCYEVSLGDTIGKGTPIQTAQMLEVVSTHINITQIAVHFHDTYGQALANILVALQAGVSVVDSAVSGLGGCPYASGASGNVATEDLVYMLNGMGIDSGIDLTKLTIAGQTIRRQLRKETQSKVAIALTSKLT